MFVVCCHPQNVKKLTVKHWKRVFNKLKINWKNKNWNGQNCQNGKTVKKKLSKYKKKKIQNGKTVKKVNPVEKIKNFNTFQKNYADRFSVSCMHDFFLSLCVYGNKYNTINY